MTKNRELTVPQMGEEVGEQILRQNADVAAEVVI